MANTAEVKSGKMPAAIPYIVGNEAAERFNYYGLRAILTTFMVAQFYNPSGSTDPSVVQVAEATANAKTHDFVAMSYLLPMFGGMASDWFLGKYKTILYLSIVYAIGNLTLATFTTQESFFTAGLMLIALGAGGIKPCVSANVGDQFDDTNQHMITKAFNAFYMSINAGSLLSILAIPYLNKHYGATVAFGVPAIAMCIAIAFFYAGRNKYRPVPLPKFDINKLVVFLTSFGSLVASYLYFDTWKQMGTGPVLGAWGVLTFVLALIFQKYWFAKPGNFVGLNLYRVTNGNSNYSVIIFIAVITTLTVILFSLLPSIVSASLVDISQYIWCGVIVLLTFLQKNKWKSILQSGTEKAKEYYGIGVVEGNQSVWRVLAVFAFIPFFWALWDQNQSEWVVQATKMDLNFMGIAWQAEQISFVNAAFILIFIPIFHIGSIAFLESLGLKVTKTGKLITAAILGTIAIISALILNGNINADDFLPSKIAQYLNPNAALQILSIDLILMSILFLPVFANGVFPTIEKLGIKATPLRKIGVGLVLTALSFVVISIIQGWIDAGQTPNIGWQILAYVILTAGEVLVYGTGLEYAYTQAPPSMKSTIMACYLLTVTLGNVLVSIIQNNIKSGGYFAKFQGADFFWLFTGICGATAIVFMFVSPYIKEKSYIGGTNVD
jgi:dipeptide/tripeptide permease